MSKKLISICIPVYNEQDNIQPLYERLAAVFQREITYEFEILFTDNHSEDHTFEVINQIASLDKRVRVLRFSKNFGFQKSIMTNYLNCRGDAAIQIDADMQDPPELISDFLRQWELGYQVVYGIRKSRPEPWLMHTVRKFFYRFIDFISEDRLPHDAGDFRLVDRCILEELRKINDAQPYLRGLIARMGFKQIGIAYDRDERKSGKSKFNLGSLMNLALEGILQHSVIPLRLATFMGFGICLISFFGAGYYFVGRLLFHNHWPTGLATISILLFFSIGINAIFLGIIGEYLGAIFKNVKRGSFVIIEKTIDAGVVK